MNNRYRINPLLFAMCTAGLCTLSTLTAALGADSVSATNVGEVNASAKALSESAKTLANTDGKLTKRKFSNPRNLRRFLENVKFRG